LKVKEDGISSDMPYMLLGKGIETVQKMYLANFNGEKVRRAWKESFELAQELKKQLGIKEFLRLAGEKHRRELEGIV